MTWTLYEPCCGAAALSTHLCGVYKRPVLPYQGSKWKLRKPLTELLVSRGFIGAPDEVHLNDMGPWGDVWSALLRPEHRETTVGLLKQWDTQDPKKVYDRLHNNQCHDLTPIYAAQYLFLQRLAFGGKSLSENNDRIWKSPGFDRWTAYGAPATEKFGKINPMLPSLIRTLEAFAWENTISWTSRRGSASDWEIEVGPGVVVYFDPPYQATTQYPGGSLSRDEVVRLARMWSKQGAFVIVSEAEAVTELGWESQCLLGPPDTGAIIRGNSPEWVTFNEAHAPPPQAIELGEFFGF